MNNAAFFAALRQRQSGVFGTSLSQGQVDGINVILGAGSHLPLPHLAYALATAYHETGHTMQPVRETFASSDDQAVARLDSAFRKGQLKWVSRPYWNKDADKKSWFGRGYVQLTHKVNYERASDLVGADLTADPSLAMQPHYAALILIEGSASGMFTGKDFDDYLPRGSLAQRDHFKGARRIINGTDRADTIAGYAMAFQSALQAAGYQPQTKPVEPLRTSPAPWVEEQPQGGLWALLARLWAFLTGGK